MVDEKHIPKAIQELRKRGYWITHIGSHDKETSKTHVDESTSLAKNADESPDLIVFHPTCHHDLLEKILQFLSEEFPEPYNLYTLRYFIELYPHLCLVVMNDSAELRRMRQEDSRDILCSENSIKKDMTLNWMHHLFLRGTLLAVCLNQVQYPEQFICLSNATPSQVVGYIAMIAVKKEYRHQGVGRFLIKTSLELMSSCHVQEVFLETEVRNIAALQFYESLGFYRVQLKTQYYLCGQDAFVLKKYLT